MFRADRIGTPEFMVREVNNLTTDFTLQQATWGSIGQPFNVINAAPIASFGSTSLHWTGTEAVTGNRKYGFAQQFSVANPLNGNSIGFELTGCINALLPVSSKVLPFVGGLNAALGAVFTGDTTATNPLYFGRSYVGTNTNEDQVMVDLHYKTQVLLRDVTAVAGVLAHGFAIFSQGGDAYNFTILDINCAVRQFNDLQDIRALDPLR